jgi:shikimate kinase
VSDIASSGDEHDRSPRHLVLIGLMGVGKSTIGRALAERLGRPLVDTDVTILERTGRTVREIFSDDGEPAFRALETDVLQESLRAEQPAVIAAAGGVVLDPVNRKTLLDADARVVWLVASPELLIDRVTSGGHRPLLDDDPAGTLARMRQDREALYREVADAVVSVDHRSVNEIVEAILR